MKKGVVIVIPILIAASGLLATASLSYLLQNGTVPLLNISEEKLVNFTFTTQAAALSVSTIAVVLIYFCNKENFKTFFRVGSNLTAASSGDDAGWRILGPIVAVAFTVGTTMYMSAGVMAQGGAMNETFVKLMPLVLLFAATNAWSEEMVARLVIIAGLHGKLKPDVICGISAGLFGLGHIFGTPNGIFGVIASGLLGWFLARSVVETRGLGWALFIHFLQDVVIFGAGAMMLAARHP